MCQKAAVKQKEKGDFFGSQTVYLREQDLRKVK